jgi:nucleotide-binding universal stress UspA family protein
MPLVRACESRITLLQVVPERNGTSPEAGGLGKVLDGLRAHGVAAQNEVRVGRPVEQILAFLKESEADLVAMTTRGRSGLSRMLRPSLTEEVLRRTGVPALVTRFKEPRPRLKRILVPLDDSLDVRRLLRDVSFLAQATGASVELLESIPPDLTASYGSSELWMRAYGPGPDAVTPSLNELANRMASTGIQVYRTRGWLFTASGILDRARDGASDLICMSNSGRTGLPRLVLGSVAEDVLRLAPCPVLLRRDEARRPGSSDPFLGDCVPVGWSTWPSSMLLSHGRPSGAPGSPG